LHGENDDPQEHEKSMEVMQGHLAKEAGVTYLEEGLRTFSLSNGAKFTVYASPYQPEFCDWAFPYFRHEDRFNPSEHILPASTCIAENPIPDFPGVDIIMTHGPPEDILDWTAHGNVGCEHLLRAVSRARPKLHCFGHIHEAYGMNLVTWKEKGISAAAIESKTERMNLYPEAQKWTIRPGKETIMINAAIMNLSYQPTNAPWLVDLDLEKAA
jgi:hypothetical protein